MPGWEIQTLWQPVGFLSHLGCLTQKVMWFVARYRNKGKVVPIIRVFPWRIMLSIGKTAGSICLHLQQTISSFPVFSNKWFMPKKCGVDSFHFIATPLDILRKQCAKRFLIMQKVFIVHTLCDQKTRGCACRIFGGGGICAFFFRCRVWRQVYINSGDE